MAALTNAPIAGRKRFNYFPGTFATDGVVYSDIVVFGHAAISPDHKLYMIKMGRTEQDVVRLRGDDSFDYPDKMLVRNNAKTPTVQKALLARFSGKPNTLTTIGAQPEEKPLNTPSKITPDNPVNAGSSKTAANQKLFSFPPNEDKDPKQLSPWKKIYNNSIRNSPKAVIPTEEVKVD
ncbi:uncharacterized protein EAE97_003876 [Botrytis byssoidea]|uniref:Uncharacterized protein n=1 Tax=Botrytis byssoidea TaxID=139641 RepID=A0A9P5M4I4_9HELO|nr:uncharacterized protein EAE97_003876 [Botrytis byssoidea]KAF7948465.1 hypothetical protein EAE97_003876 [Botrytis byssoidea]